MKEALQRLLTSMKFWTTLIGLIVTAGSSWLAKYGLELSDETVQQIAVTVAGFFGLLLAGQAATDHGKAKAQTQAEAAGFASSEALKPTIGAVMPHPDGVTVALSNGEAHQLSLQQLAAAGLAPIAKDAPKQGGFVSLKLLAVLALIAIAIGGCAWWKKHDGTGQVISSVVKCSKNAEFKAAKKQFSTLVDYAVIRSLGGDGSIDKAALKDSFRDAAVATGGCLLADSFKRLSKAALEALAAGIKSEGATVTAVQGAEVLDDLYPGITFEVD